MKNLLFLLLVFSIYNRTFAQLPVTSEPTDNTITTGVPFLLITPDPVGSAMGESGVATANDIYSLFWNPSKYGATDHLQGNDPSKDFRVALSYAPWWRQVVDDMWIGSFYASKLISENSAISTSFRYFSWGDITFSNLGGDVIGNKKPVEWTADIAYSQRLSEHWYGGVALRYIYSNLAPVTLINGLATKTGTSVAADLSVYYEKQFGKNNNLVSFGANIANIGTKISYIENSEIDDFIPTLLRIGPSFYWNLHENHQFRFSCEFDKLLVPTPPYYALDSLGRIIHDHNNDPVISKGMSNDVSVLRGMFQSFYDAPEGFKEEIHEISTSIGLEYRFYNIVSVRGGYYTQHKTKGNNKYFTAGLGVKYKFIEANIARIIDPEKGRKDGNNLPGYLHKTMRYSVAFDLAGIYE